MASYDLCSMKHLLVTWIFYLIAKSRCHTCTEYVTFVKSEDISMIELNLCENLHNISADVTNFLESTTFLIEPEKKKFGGCHVKCLKNATCNALTFKDGVCELGIDIFQPNVSQRNAPSATPIFISDQHFTTYVNGMYFLTTFY